MIEVRDIVKIFDGNVVLDHVSTTLLDGEVNMIIGQSGSGKTVLMKSIIGLHSVDSGQILFDGRDLAKMSSKEIRMLHREVGMLFQGSALFDSMSVMENVRFPMEMFSRQSASITRLVFGSRPELGSSQNRYFGSNTIARAIATRFC